MILNKSFKSSNAAREEYAGCPHLKRRTYHSNYRWLNDKNSAKTANRILLLVKKPLITKIKPK